MFSTYAKYSLHDNLQILTDFGDSAVLLPLSAVFFIWLLVTHPASVGLKWLLILAACNFLIAGLKLYFLACPAGAAMHSPSGHTGFAIFVYGSLTAALASGLRERWLRGAAIAMGTAFVGAIAASRLMLGKHSVMEVVIGAIVGGIGLVLFLPTYRRSKGPSRCGPLSLLGLVGLLVAVIFHGEQFPAEHYLQSLGMNLRLHAQACLYR
jgi:membrane-associated phospholipid phosphatase